MLNEDNSDWRVLCPSECAVLSGYMAALNALNAEANMQNKSIKRPRPVSFDVWRDVRSAEQYTSSDAEIIARRCVNMVCGHDLFQHTGVMPRSDAFELKDR